MLAEIRFFVSIAILTVISLWMPTWVLAENRRSVIDLTEVEMTTERLVDALRPEVEPPPLSRSLVKPSCKRFHQQVNRGIRPAPVSQEVAITVEFESDSSILTPQARKALDRLGKALQDPRLAGCCFRIEGHTDSRNTEDYNLRLSKARAARVTRYLAEQFFLETDRLLQEAMGESQPLASNDTPVGRQKNRRVQVTTLGYQSVEGMP